MLNQLIYLPATDTSPEMWFNLTNIVRVELVAGDFLKLHVYFVNTHFLTVRGLQATELIRQLQQLPGGSLPNE